MMKILILAMVRFVLAILFCFSKDCGSRLNSVISRSGNMGQRHSARIIMLRCLVLRLAIILSSIALGVLALYLEVI